ncbi:hypothetical protein [Croceivirga radicis]|uniref:hypothetical protein n=1 Tax=Croceivirga radicis TaxID=1929488 RepID=UPI000255AF9C|nr:hypothetical protein [Croceivirga radicis]
MRASLLLLLVLLMSCSRTLDKNGLFKESEFAKHHLEYVNASVFLPKNHIEVDKNKLKAFLANQGEAVPPNVQSMWMANLASPHSGISIFKDATDSLNFVVIKKYPSHIPVTIKTSEIIQEIMKGYLETNKKNYQVGYTIDESTFSKVGMATIYKFAYTTTAAGLKASNLRFFIAFKDQTIDVQVVNSETYDYDTIFKNLEIN